MGWVTYFVGRNEYVPWHQSADSVEKHDEENDVQSVVKMLSLFLKIITFLLLLNSVSVEIFIGENEKFLLPETFNNWKVSVVW